MFGSPKLIGTTGTTGTHVVNIHLLLFLYEAFGFHTSSWRRLQNGLFPIRKRPFPNQKTAFYNQKTAFYNQKTAVFQP